MPIQFKGVLLDIDNTIYDYNTCHTDALERVVQYCEDRLEIDRDKICAAYSKSRKAIHTELSGTASSHNRLLYFQRMLELLSINAMAHNLDIYNIYWDTFLERMVFLDGVKEVLDSLQEHDVCLVTDLTAHIQFRKIQKLRLFKYADFIVTSEEAGIEKPHKKIFTIALQKLNMRPEEVCMIGDNYEKDVVGAISLGIHTFWLNRENKKIDFHPLITEFKDFKDLRGIFDD